MPLRGGDLDEDKYTWTVDHLSSPCREEKLVVSRSAPRTVVNDGRNPSNEGASIAPYSSNTKVAKIQINVTSHLDYIFVGECGWKRPFRRETATGHPPPNEK